MKNWKSFLLVMLVVLSIPATAQVITGQTDNLELGGAKFQLVPWDTVIMRPGDEAKVGKKCETSKKDFFHNTVTCTWEKTINATEAGLVESGEVLREHIEWRITIFLLGIPMVFMALTMMYSFTELYVPAKMYSIAATITTIILGFIAADVLSYVAIMFSMATLYFVLSSSRVTKIFYVTAISYIFLMFWFFWSLL